MSELTVSELEGAGEVIGSSQFLDCHDIWHHLFQCQYSPFSPDRRVRHCVQLRKWGLPHNGVWGETAVRLLPFALDNCHTPIVVLMGPVTQGCALQPLKTRLERAAYDLRIATSRVTAGFCLGWENHHLTITKTAAQ